MPVSQNDKTVTLSLPSGANATVYLFGAHVTSWKTSDGKERLYMSEKSALDGSAPIRGGIPIGWPNVGPGPTDDELAADSALKPHKSVATLMHMFARTLYWQYTSSDNDGTSAVSAKFTLPSSSFPSPFPQVAQLSYVVTLTDKSLTSALTVSNPKEAKEDLKFKALYHTYFAVKDLKNASVKGLKQGQRFTNNYKDGEPGEFEGGEIKLSEKIGRQNLEVDAPNGLTLQDGSDSLTITWKGLEDCIIWNPLEDADSFPDVPVGDGNRFTCVEPGYFHAWKSISPGEEFVASQTITAA